MRKAKWSGEYRKLRVASAEADQMVMTAPTRAASRLPVCPRLPLEPPAPGMYPGTPADDYHRWAAVSRSLLWMVERDGLEHARAWLDAGLEEAETEEMIFGGAFHCRLLEPERYERSLVRLPDINKRSPKERNAREEFKSERPTDSIFLEGWEITEIEEMTHRVRSKELVRHYLDHAGESEVSMVWTDQATGLLCKGRVDRRAIGLGLFDAKTCTKASDANVARATRTYGYHVQAALYEWGYKVLNGATLPYGIVWAEKEGVRGVRLMTYDRETIDGAGAIARKSLTRLSEALDTGIWPGYPDRFEEINIWTDRYAAASLEDSQ